MSNNKIFQKVRDKFPQNPGVYFFRGPKKEILYIGKATNLRSRVGSYFRGTETREHIGLMMPSVSDVGFQEADSVLDALILESNLIKKYQPKYNMIGKDDKSFSYFVVTKEDFPRILILRKTDLKNYVILSEAKNPRKSSDSGINNGILHYVQDDNAVKSKKLQTKNYKLKTVFGPYISKHQMQVALKIIRRIFPFHSMNQKTEKGCLDFQLGLCPGPYAGVISRKDYMKNIRGIKMILEGKKKNLLKKLEREMQTYSKQNEFEKAAGIRNKLFALKHINDVALLTSDFAEKSSIISHQSSVFRIEAYDISNISGTNAVGSMVVFAGINPDKSQYRKFKIRTIEGSDDVGMMREVLLRRFKNDWPMPDLVLLDGGQGHLNMAEKLIYEELGLAVALVAVAKGPSRKNLELRISNGEKITDTVKNILNDKNLVKRIMDEAHRFAIRYHRKLRHENASK